MAKSYSYNDIFKEIKNSATDGILRVEIDAKELNRKLGNSEKQIKKDLPDLSKTLAEKVVKFANEAGLVPFKNEYRLRKRKKGVKGKYYESVFTKEETLMDPIFNDSWIEKRTRTINGSTTKSKAKRIGYTIVQEKVYAKNKDGTIKHKTNGKPVYTLKNKRKEVYDYNSLTTLQHKEFNKEVTSEIKHGGSEVIGYVKTKRTLPNKVSESSTDKRTAYAKGKAYITKGDSGFNDPATGKWMTLEETNAYADRPPHLRDSYSFVKSSNGKTQIKYKVQKTKNDVYTEGNDYAYYAVKQYDAQDASWKRFTKGTTSHWLEVAIGLPVSGVKVPSIPSGDANYQKLVKLVEKSARKSLKK